MNSCSLLGPYEGKMIFMLKMHQEFKKFKGFNKTYP